jgi:hypothetical protein
MPRIQSFVCVLTLFGLAGCSDRLNARPAVSPLFGGADVRTCGAVADGSTSDTLAIQSAIDRVAAGGGGVVDFPPGRYLTGTLFLRSGVTLHLQKDAVLRGSTNYFDYYNLAAVDQAELPATNYSQDEARFSGIIVALDQHDIAITGDGTIDGRGNTVALNIHSLQQQKQIPGDPKYRPDESLRPTLMNFVRCQNVKVSGVTLRDSSCWVEVYCDCDGVDVSDVTVRSLAYWNNDGIDICGSKNVRVTNFDAEVTDDGICLKSNSAGVENVTISHCKLKSWANGIKMGTVSCVGFNHINIDHVDVTTAGHSGLALESVDGGWLHDVHVSDMAMSNVTNGIFIKLGERHRQNGVAGRVNGITIKNVTGTLRSDDPDGPPSADVPFPPNPRGFDHNSFPPVIVSGFPGHPVVDVHLQNIRFVTPGGGSTEIAEATPAGVLEYANTYPEYSMHGELPSVGWYCRHVSGLTVASVDVRLLAPDYRPVYLFDDIQNLHCDHFTAEGDSDEPLIAIRGVKTATITDGATDGYPAQILHRLAGCGRIISRGLVHETNP